LEYTSNISVGIALRYDVLQMLLFRLSIQRIKAHLKKF